MSDVLQVSVSALEADTDDQCGREKFSGGEKKDGRTWTI